MQNIINKLKELGYNLKTLEQTGNKIHFMCKAHLVIIKQNQQGYELHINSPNSRYKTSTTDLHDLTLKLADYFC